MMFEKGKIYDFELERPVISGSKNYFLLTYGPDKAATLPGFEENHWQFRVEVLPCQTNWNTLPAGTKISCFVKDYIYDMGTPTVFPFLVQDTSAILKQYYTAGGTYTFTVSNRQPSQDSQSQLIWYNLTDAYGLKHSYPTCEELTPGADISLTVDKVTFKLEFVNEVQKKIRENFKAGESYDFEIVDQKTDPKSGKKFFILKDGICNYSIHRYYYEGQLSEKDTEGTEDTEPKYAVGNTIKLKVQLFMKNGWPLLTLPQKTFNNDQCKNLELLPSGNLGLENNNLEYKSSIVYTGDGKQDIDEQLGHVIMKEIASFMNSCGGTLCLGFRDDGEVVGIENDLSLLETGSLPPGYKYPPTLDSFERRIRLMVTDRLGATANSLLENSFHFYAFEKEDVHTVVCQISVPRSNWPIYLNEQTLYKRCGNMCQKLLGNDITFFIQERMRGIDVNKSETETSAKQFPDADEELKTVKGTELKPVSAEEKSTPVPRKELSGKGFYLTFLKNENQVLRGNKPFEDKANVLHEIFIDNDFKKKTGRLLLCYANGRVRFLKPGDVYKDKLTKANHPYAYGYSTESPLKNVLVCRQEDYLVIRSTDTEGKHWVKAVAVKEHATATNVKGASMASKGNMIVNERLATIDSMEIIASESSSFIFPVIKYRTTLPGFPEDDLRISGAVAYLNSLKEN